MHFKKGLVDGMTVSKDSFDQQCEACASGKMHRVPFQKGSSNRATRPLELVHSDVCGPMNVPSIGGSKNMLTFTDDFTRYITVYFIASKSEVLSKFKEFVNASENKLVVQVKRLSIFNEAKESVVKLRSDNGGENTCHEFTNYCKERGISHEFTNAYALEQNGVPERLNRTLIESARSMMYHAKLPLNFWAEAASTAAYLRNRSPTTAVNSMTSYECRFGQKPSVSNPVFGCVCFVHTPDNLRKKLDAKSSKAFFVGYPLDTKGYKVYDLASKRFIRSRNVLFHEEKFHDFELEKSKLYFKKFMKVELKILNSQLRLFNVSSLLFRKMFNQWEQRMRKHL